MLAQLGWIPFPVCFWLGKPQETVREIWKGKGRYQSLSSSHKLSTAAELPCHWAGVVALPSSETKDHALCRMLLRLEGIRTHANVSLFSLTPVHACALQILLALQPFRRVQPQS